MIGDKSNINDFKYENQLLKQNTKKSSKNILSYSKITPKEIFSDKNYSLNINEKRIKLIEEKENDIKFIKKPIISNNYDIKVSHAITELSNIKKALKKSKTTNLENNNYYSNWISLSLKHCIKSLKNNPNDNDLLLTVSKLINKIKSIFSNKSNIFSNLTLNNDTFFDDHKIETIKEFIRNNKNVNPVIVYLCGYLSPAYYKDLFLFSNEEIEKLSTLFTNLLKIEHCLDCTNYDKMKDLFLYLSYFKIPINLFTDKDKSFLTHIFNFFDPISNYTKLDRLFNILEYKSLTQVEKSDEFYINCFNNAKNFQELYLLLITTPELFNLINSHEFTYPKDIHNNYIVRVEDWAANLYHPDQKSYGELMHKGVTFATYALQKYEWNFEQLLAYLACHRMHIAVSQQKEYEASRMGLFRCRENAITDCNDGGPYQKLGERLQEKIKSWEYEKHPHVVTDSNKTMIVEKNINTYQEIKLSSFLELFWMQTFLVGHTDWKEVLQVMEFLPQLYEEALKETKEEELMKKLGGIFWWICQAKPWMLGDPSIAEMLIRTVWLHKTGNNLPPWQLGLVPWESVMEEPSAQSYAENFSKLFDYSYAKG